MEEVTFDLVIKDAFVSMTMEEVQFRQREQSLQRHRGRALLVVTYWKGRGPKLEQQWW